MEFFWDSITRLLYLILPPQLSIDALYIFGALLFGVIIYLIGKFIK